MRIVVVVTYKCDLDPEDEKRIENGTIGPEELDFWHYVDKGDEYLGNVWLEN